jgi:hypothetical protein
VDTFAVKPVIQSRLQLLSTEISFIPLRIQPLPYPHTFSCTLNSFLSPHFKSRITRITRQKSQGSANMAQKKLRVLER